MTRAIRYLSPLPLSLLLIVPALERVAAVPGYEIVDLGSLGGPGSEGRAINNAGQVTGKSYCPGFCSHAFRYTSAPMTDLGTLGGTQSQGNAINDAGQVAGYSTLSGDVQFQAFRYTTHLEGMEPLGTLTGGAFSSAYAINSAGQVTGSANTADANVIEHAFLYTDGVSMIDLGADIFNTLGYPNSFGIDINANGDVVGRAYSNLGPGQFFSSFLYPKDGVPVDLTPEGGNALAINDAGQVTGGFQAPDGTIHAFLYQNGVRTFTGSLGGAITEGLLINTNGDVAGRGNAAGSRDQHFFIKYSGDAMRNLGNLGGSEIYPMAINANGEVVGFGYTLNDAENHAFVFRNLVEGLVDLNLLIPANSGWVLEEAWGINDSGWITGTGRINGQRHAFLLKPVTTAAPPTISKTFAHSTITLGANTTLTFRLGNPNPTPLTGVSFTDPLPTGIIVATPNGLTGSCGGTVTAVAGSSSIALSGGTLAANASCAFSVTVKGNSVSPWTNVTSPVNSTEGGLGAAAAANIEVTDPLQNCVGATTSAYAQEYGGLKKAAAALGYSGVQLLQDAIKADCGK